MNPFPYLQADTLSICLPTPGGHTTVLAGPCSTLQQVRAAIEELEHSGDIDAEEAVSLGQQCNRELRGYADDDEGKPS